MNDTIHIQAMQDFALLDTLAPGVLADLRRQAQQSSAPRYFLSAKQMQTLSALCACYIPGPPVDRDPGAIEAGVPILIDFLLGVFDAPLPAALQHHASQQENFTDDEAVCADLLSLDALQQRTWRTRIQGSQGKPEREWSGAVTGLQANYIDGLERLDRYARRLTFRPFHALPFGGAHWLMRLSYGELRRFLEVSMQHSMCAMYGLGPDDGEALPEAWRYCQWPGRRPLQPYTRTQIESGDE